MLLPTSVGEIHARILLYATRRHSSRAFALSGTLRVDSIARDAINYGFIKRKKVNLSEKTRPAGRPMETIVLSDDEEAAPRTGLCIHCGQVSKPHACPHGTVKIMKPLSKSKCHPAKKQR